MQMITLPVRCDRAATTALLPEISDAIGDTPVKIDAGKVEQIGQAMLQLLVSAAQTESGIELAAASTEFSKAVKLAKLDQTLMVGEDA